MNAREQEARRRSAHKERVASDPSDMDEDLEFGGAAANGLDELTPHMRERIDELIESGRRRVHDLRDRVRHDVKHKPVQSLLVAAGVGALVGLLVGRRH